MGTFVHMIFSGSLLIAAVLIFRSFTYHRLPKRLFVLMWCIILARLLIPGSVPVERNTESGTAARQLITSLLPESFEIRPYNTARPIGELRMQEIDRVDGSEPKAQNSGALKDGAQIGGSDGMLNGVLTAVWIAVGTLMAAFIFSNHARWLRRCRVSLPAEEPLIETWKDSCRGIRGIQIRRSDQITAPLTYGLFRPVILLPADLRWENDRELFCILEHERMHIKYFDVCVKYAMCLALSIYWFHPLVWLMYILLTRDMEAACDEEVLRRFHGVTKSDYALLLVKLADRQSRDTALSAGFSHYSDMKERITSIMKAKKYTLPAAALALILLLGMTCAFTVAKKPAPADTQPAFSLADGAKKSPQQPDTVQPGITQPDITQPAPAQSDISQPAPPSPSHTPAGSGQLTVRENSGSEAPAPVTLPSDVTGSEIAELSTRYVGSPYLYGGTDLETGVDSSGFIKAVFALKGISLPHSSRELAETGTPVELDQLIAGDLVIYGRTNQDSSISPSHSAIYLGNGEVIHASNAREGVKISELEYREPYSACRILPAE